MTPDPPDPITALQEGAAQPVHRVQTILACGCFLTYVDERITGWWPCEHHDPEESLQAGMRRGQEGT